MKVRPLANFFVVFAIVLASILGYSAENPSPIETTPKPTVAADSGSTVGKKKQGSGPVPMLGVREAKAKCEEEGAKGKDLVECVKTKMKKAESQRPSSTIIGQ